MRIIRSHVARTFFPLIALATALQGRPEVDRRIEAALAESYNFRVIMNENVKSDVHNGVVTLTGTVENRHQRALAEDTARSVPGVAEIRNHLDVQSPGRERSDGWIELRIRGGLLVRDGVSATGTNISVQNGVVTLRGVAQSEAQKELTETYARGVEGVRAVRNELRLEDKTGETKPDSRQETARR